MLYELPVETCERSVRILTSAMRFRTKYGWPTADALGKANPELVIDTVNCHNHLKRISAYRASPLPGTWYTNQYQSPYQSLFKAVAYAALLIRFHLLFGASHA